MESKDKNINDNSKQDDVQSDQVSTLSTQSTIQIKQAERKDLGTKKAKAKKYTIQPSKSSKQNTPSQQNKKVNVINKQKDIKPKEPVKKKVKIPKSDKEKNEKNENKVVKKPSKKKKLVIQLKNCQYPVVKEVAKKHFKWKVTRREENP